MRILLLAMYLFFSSDLVSQVVSSDCTAPDSIVDLYRTDADRLALYKIFEQQLSDTDNVWIQFEHVDTVLRALLAVYNAIDLPARDTVVEMFEVHTRPAIFLDRLSIAGGQSQLWVQAMQNDAFPTGHVTIDSLMTLYSLQQYSSYTFPPPISTYIAYLEAPFSLNTLRLREIFDQIPEVHYADLSLSTGGGFHIFDSIHTDYVELIYNIGWLFCQNGGCMYNRYWQFYVYDDCSVEYVSSWGDPLDPALYVYERSVGSVKVYPNPFTDRINVDGRSPGFVYELKHSLGQIVRQGIAMENSIDDLGGLPSGIYFITIRTDDRTITTKLVKE